MATLLDLAKRMDRTAKKLDKAASNLVAFVALELTAELADVTPVDTSNAISNWQIGLGAPVSSEREPYYPGHKGSTESMSEDATVIAARIKLKGKKPKQKVYLSNLAPYIVDLDGGSSLQEPGGFVKRAVDNAERLATAKNLEL